MINRIFLQFQFYVYSNFNDKIAWSSLKDIQVWNNSIDTYYFQENKNESEDHNDLGRTILGELNRLIFVKLYYYL